jgi:dinuclear metal center YbgI/SA1388 family protein
METRKKIVSYLDRYLNTQPVKDTSWNGLQFEGAKTVKKIAFSVDAGVEVFEQAVEEKAGMLIVHHGMYWKYTDPSVNGVNKKRLDILYKNNISLYACHLPLDMHKKVGNNAEILRLIGARISGEFGLYDGASISFTGHYKKPATLQSVTKKLEKAFNIKCTVLPFGPEKIKSVGVVSGGAGHSCVGEAIERRLDLYITGEELEVYHMAKDAGINIIFAGHNATETTGIKALQKHIGKKLKVKTVFIDVPTGL